MWAATVPPGHISGTEPALVSEQGALTEALRPHAGLISAVHALYRACHRQPPAVLVAPSADEYVRMVRQVSLRGPDYLATRLLATLLLPCLMLAGLILVFTVSDPEKVARAKAETWVVLLFSVSAGIALWSTIQGHGLLREGLPFRAPTSALWAGYGSGAAIGAAIVSLFGGDALHLIAGGVAGLIIAVLVHFATLLLWPVRGRLRLRRVYGAKLPLVADRSIRDLIEPRIEAAGRESAESRPRSLGEADHYGLRRDRPPTAGPIETTGRPFGLAMWHFIGPVLGPVSEGNGRYYLLDAVRQAADPEELPGVLRAAAQVDAEVDAASFFARTAVLLPAHAPLTIERASSVASRWRRSRRPPYREVLMVARSAPLVQLKIDVAWSQAQAERMMAKQVLGIEDAARRQEAIRAMGEGRFVAAAGIRPVQEDSLGELYMIGPEQTPLALVKVRDASPTADGVHREHWLSVPPHVATAREAVAWTFGMSESAYSPTAES
jgi:uncharacterized protein DUF6745